MADTEAAIVVSSEEDGELMDGGSDDETEAMEVFDFPEDGNLRASVSAWQGGQELPAARSEPDTWPPSENRTPVLINPDAEETFQAMLANESGKPKRKQKVVVDQLAEKLKLMVGVAGVVLVVYGAYQAVLWWGAKAPVVAEAPDVSFAMPGGIE